MISQPDNMDVGLITQKSFLRHHIIYLCSLEDEQ